MAGPSFGFHNALSGLGGTYGSNPYANQQSISYEEMLRQQRQMLMVQSMQAQQAQMAQWPPSYPQTSTTSTASSGSLPDNAIKPRRTENHMTVRDALQHHVDKWLRDVKLPLRISV